MANYKDIQGFPIQNLSSDPVPYAQELANNPYAGVWSSGGNMNTARESLAGNGTQTAAFAVAGRNASNTDVTSHEQYDGSSWTEVADLNAGRYNNAGSGIVTAALTYGGTAGPPVYALTESWNGSAWTEVGDLNTARSILAGAGYGVNTAALAAGGEGPPANMAFVEEWNGSSWTEIADLSTGRGGLGGAGTSTAGLVFGGEVGPRQQTEEWNGSSITTKVLTD